jgi:hypothetical protein
MYFWTCFGGSPSVEAAKICNMYKKNQYVHELTDERIDICLSVKRGT